MAKKAKKDVPVKKKKTLKESTQERNITPTRTFDVWTDFDRIFEDFRRGFEDLLWPLRTSARPLFPISGLDVRVPPTDLEDRGKDFLLKTELPGFKKEDKINIIASRDSIRIEANAGWEYDNESQNYICKERECKSFYREESLPEDIDINKVEATLEDGILEIVLPKKAPKETKKIDLK